MNTSFHGPMPNPLGSAEWSPRAEALRSLTQPQMSYGNRALHSFLLGVTGRYLHCISTGHPEVIPFTYDVRGEAPGFLKLDVLSEMMVVGVDMETGPVVEFLPLVEKAYYIATTINRSGGMVAIVPIVVFGAYGSYIFYIESPRGFGSVCPFFIEVAQQFVANQLLPAYLNSAKGQIGKYIQTLAQDGHDSAQLLDRQPLFHSLMSNIPSEAKIEMIRQIGSELANRLLTPHSADPH